MAKLKHEQLVVPRQWWKSIRYAVAGALDDPHVKIADPSKPLGCGDWGCVYLVESDPRWVVKVSCDCTEGPVVAQVIADRYLREMAGTARYAAIWRLGENAELYNQPQPVFIILRENITPISQLVDLTVRGWWPTGLRAAADILVGRPVLVGRRVSEERVTPDGHMPMLDAGKLVFQLQAAIERQEEVPQSDFAAAMYEWTSAVHALEEKAPWGRDLARFCRAAFERRGIVVADVHLGNLGTRSSAPTQLVNYDLGHSSHANTYPSITTLASRQENPRLRIPVLRLRR